MATQTITTRFKSEGAGRVAKDTEAVGRAQTRLGQASASAGRSFSAQANGLGGLVGVYAAAAANVFAITAAFDALGRAAQAEQIVRGTKLLALEIGQSGQTILDNVQKITQSQLTLAEASQNINIALSAGFNTKQIEELSEVSLRASRALGRNLTDAFQRVVRGASKLEPELLDELGIFTRIDPAVEAYASKLNIATNSLTNYEKRQAFVNAVIEEGQKKFSAIDINVDSSQKTFEQLRVALTELALTFGQLVANVLVPVAEFFKNNLGNALLLFGGILALVFGRAISSISGFAGSSLIRFGEFTEGLAKTTASAKRNFAEIQKAQESLQQSVKDRRGLAQEGGRFAQKGVARSDASAAAGARTRFLSGQSLSLNQQKDDLRALKAVQNQLGENTAAYKDADKIIKTYTKSTQSAGAATVAFSRVSRAASVAAKGLAVGIGFLTRSLNVLLLAFGAVQLITSVFGFDILGKLQKAFFATSKAAEDLNRGITGTIVAVSGGLQNFERELRALGATDDDIENLKDTIKDLNEEVAELAEKGSGNIIKTAQSLGIISSEFGIMDARSFKAFRTLAQGTRTFIALTQQIDELKDAGDKVGAAILTKRLEAFKKFGDSLTLIGGIASQTGLPAEQVAKLFEEVVTVSDDFGTTIVEILPGVTDLSKGFEGLEKEQQKLVENFVLAKNTVESANAAFDAGTASAETLSKKLGGLVSSIEILRELGLPVQFINSLQESADNISDNVRRLKTLESVTKALTTTYGKFGAVLDKAVQDGLVGIGGLSKDAVDVAQNQARFLAQQTEHNETNGAEVAKALADQERGATLDSIQVNLLVNRTKALKTIAGLIFDTAQGIEKETIARKKTLKTLEDQEKTLNAQLELQRLQTQLTVDQAIQSANITSREKGLEILTEEAKITQLNLDLVLANIDQQNALNNLLREKNDLLRTGAEIDAQSQARTDRASRERGIAAQESRISDIQAFPNLRSLQELQAEQRKLIDLQLANDLSIINEKERATKVESLNSKIALDNQIQALKEEGTAESARITIRRQLAASETGLRLVEQSLAEDKIKNDQANNLARKAIIDQELQNARLAIDIAEGQAKVADEESRKQLDILEANVKLVNALKETLNGESTFVNAINAFLEEQAPGSSVQIAESSLAALDIDFSALRGIQSSIEGQRATNFGVQRDLAGDKAGKAEAARLVEAESLKDLLKKTTQLFEKQQEIANLELKLANTENKNAQDLIQKKIENLEIEIDNEEKLLSGKLQDYADERAAANDTHQERIRQLDREKQTLGDLGNAVIGNINDGVGKAFNAAFDNLAEGKSITDGLGAVLKQTFDSVRKSVLEETLIKPLQEKIKSGLGSLFGFEEKGADNATVRNGALLVTSDDGSVTAAADAITDEGASAFAEIGTKLGEFKDGVAEVFTDLGSSAKDVFSSVGSVLNEIGSSIGSGASGIGDFFSGIFGGGASSDVPTPGPMGLASGGIVRMAAGGMMRDRVPALLEPGEFVMKRSAAKGIGGPALNQMNATGSAGGNVVVNIKNEGTPQDATASQPMFDGEKFVVDIVTRDLRNNGPIRKSMRGGS